MRGRDGQEPSALEDVGQSLAGVPLAVGDVDKVCAANPLMQGIPSVAMGLIADGVTVGAAIGTAGEDPEQLLQMGAMVFFVAVGDLRGCVGRAGYVPEWRRGTCLRK